jgi:DNA modification methylase
MDMDIKNMAVTALLPYEKNTKAHPEDQVARIAASIKEFGFNQPVLVDGSGVLVAGHGRVLAAQSLGLEAVPTICVDHLTPEQVRAYRIADNKTAESDWLDEVLRQELDDLRAAGYDLELTGFSDDEIGEILGLDEGEGLTDPDDVPDVDEGGEPTVRKGEVWQLGRHRMMCGDSTSMSDVGGLVDGESMECLVTDPPYNVDYAAKNRYLNNKRSGTQHRDIENDHLNDGAFRGFLDAVFAAAAAVTRPGGGCYVFHADSYSHEFRAAMAAAGFLHKQTIIWVKNAAVISRQDYHWRHEPCLYGWRAGGAHRWAGDRKQNTVIEDDRAVTITPDEDGSGHVISFSDGIRTCVIRVPEYEIAFDGTDEMTTCWRVPRPLKSADHPTMKPVGLIARAIKNSSQKGDPILDLFLGSGTTLIACEQTGRTCYGMELDPAYCDVIIKRWEAFAGKKAELVRGVE